MMRKDIRFRRFCLMAFLLSNFSLKAQDVSLKIHLQGVYGSTITLLPMSGADALKPIIEKPGVKNGETATLVVPKDRLPGQFVLRFNYQEKQASNPYPSEKFIFINNQNLELWVRPKAVNNPDSTYFQKGEKENTLFNQFSNESGKKKEQLGLLQNFLIAYDRPQSNFYLEGTREYEDRRKQYNQWLSLQIELYKDAFISNIFPFEFVQPIEWKGTERQKMNSLIDHYFDNMDFKNPQVVKTAQLRDWMDKYVNIYGTMATTIQLRDSLFTLAGKRAIEKAREGHPLVYGWMVDYFYAGFEGFNIQTGIQMLQPYLGDPRCLTNKRIAIEKRLKGIETLVPGAFAPDFMLKDNSGKLVEFSKYKTSQSYKLVLFWSADCQHCKELMKDLHPWHAAKGNKKMEVFAISLDDTETEIPVWENAKLKLPGFRHSRAQGGINSPEANAYFVLSTPVMILVDSKTNKIVALPEKLDQLEKSVK